MSQALAGSDVGDLSFGSPINASALLIILLHQVIESHTLVRHADALKAVVMCLLNMWQMFALCYSPQLVRRIICISLCYSYKCSLAPDQPGPEGVFVSVGHYSGHFLSHL